MTQPKGTRQPASLAVSSWSLPTVLWRCRSTSHPDLTMYTARAPALLRGHRHRLAS
jgi:hypothetical protein